MKNGKWDVGKLRNGPPALGELLKKSPKTLHFSEKFAFSRNLLHSVKNQCQFMSRLWIEHLCWRTRESNIWKVLFLLNTIRNHFPEVAIKNIKLNRCIDDKSLFLVIVVNDFGSEQKSISWPRRSICSPNRASCSHTKGNTSNKALSSSYFNYIKLALLYIAFKINISTTN